MPPGTASISLPPHSHKHFKILLKPKRKFRLFCGREIEFSTPPPVGQPVMSQQRGAANAAANAAASFPLHWEYFSSLFYLLMPITGICLNTYVLYKLRKIARLNTFRFETSSALPLLAMSISDCLCLVALFAQAFFHTGVKFNRSYHRTSLVQPETVALATLFCKVDLYLLHVTSGYSVWCWLLLSILRYTAVFHPLRYIRIWRQPRNALLVLALCSLLLEMWIPHVVLYEPTFASCYEDTSYHLSLRQTGHLLDILFAYVVPTSIRILLDGIVLCYCYLPNVHEVPVTQRRYGISAPSSVPAAATSLMENPKRKQHQKLSVVVSISRQSIVYQHPEIMRRKQSMIKRSLIISAVNLCCNLPSHALRTIWTLDSAEQLIPERYLLALETISQLLYFAQFTCNALYLSTTIYETSTYPSTYRSCLVRQQTSTGTGTLRRTSKGTDGCNEKPN